MDYFHKKFREHLHAVNEFMIKNLESSVKEVNEVFQWVADGGGKMLRPILVIAVAEALGSVNQRTITGAALVEIVHIASLLHDDVIDNGLLRRGKPALHRIWGNTIAILTGDSLLSKGIRLAVTHKEWDFLNYLSIAVEQITEGEIMEQSCVASKNAIPEVSTERYIEIVKKKTAVLLATATVIGALSTNTITDTYHLNKLWNYGINLGIAFQISDDMIDLLPHQLTHKSSYSDLKSGIPSFPIVVALKYPHIKEKLIRLITGNDYEGAVRLLNSPEIISEYTKHIVSFIEEANANLSDGFPAPLIETSRMLGEWILSRYPIKI